MPQCSIVCIGSAENSMTIREKPAWHFWKRDAREGFGQESEDLAQAPKARNMVARGKR